MQKFQHSAFIWGRYISLILNSIFFFFGDLSCYLGGQRKTGNTKPALGQKKGKVIFSNKNH